VAACFSRSLSNSWADFIWRTRGRAEVKVGDEDNRRRVIAIAVAVGRVVQLILCILITDYRSLLLLLLYE